MRNLRRLQAFLRNIGILYRSGLAADFTFAELTFLSKYVILGSEMETHLATRFGEIQQDGGGYAWEGDMMGLDESEDEGYESVV